MTLIIAPSPDNFSVGSTTQYCGLTHSSDTVTTEVRQFDISCESAAAIFEIQLFRTSTVGSDGGTTSRYIRGNQPNANPTAKWGTFSSPTLDKLMGRWYYHAGTGLFQLKFPDEPFGCLRDAETGTDYRPMLSVQRLDTSTAVDVHVDIIFEEY